MRRFALNQLRTRRKPGTLLADLSSLRTRGKLFPLRGGTNGLLKLSEEFRFRVIVLPAPCLIKLDEMIAAAPNQLAPFMRKLIVAMSCWPCLHGRATSSRRLGLAQ